MIEKKEITVEGKTYVLRQFPARAGRQIYDRMQAINGDAEKKDELEMRIMPYVSAKPDPNNPNYEIVLDSEVMINQQVPGVKELMQIEEELLAWNFDFLSRGEISVCLTLATQGVADSMRNIEMLTDFLRQSLTAAEQPSTNSKRSTRSKTHSTFGKA